MSITTDMIKFPILGKLDVDPEMVVVISFLDFSLGTVLFYFSDLFFPL